MEWLIYRNFYNKVLPLFSVLVLTQCQTVQEVTGMKKVAPDAWSVEPMHNLEIPPGFHDMPSDRPLSQKILSSKYQESRERKQKNCPSDQAEQSLLEHVQPFLKK